MWNSMETFPKDGTRCEILCEHGAIIKEAWWGKHPIGNKMCIIGPTNFVSPYLTLKGWRVRIEN